MSNGKIMLTAGLYGYVTSPENCCFAVLPYRMRAINKSMR